MGQGIDWMGSAAVIAMIAAGWFAFNVLIPIKPRHRGKAFGLTVLSLVALAVIGAMSQARVESELARLRTTDIDGYLALYKQHHTITEYATELKSIDPARWERELPEIQKIAAAESESTMSGSLESVQAKLKDSQPQWNEETRREIWIVQGQDAVRQKLKDPDSASFRNAGVSNKSGLPVSCGEVNSKNSFGGFTGFQRYVSAGSADFTFLEEEVKDFDELWRKMCD